MAKNPSKTKATANATKPAKSKKSAGHHKRERSGLIPFFTAIDSKLNASIKPSTLTLSVGSGGLSVDGAAATSTVTLTGTVAAINAALASLSYVPDDGFSGSDTLSVSYQNGDYNDMTASNSLAITVN